MNYFKQNEKYIEKYEVSFKKDELLSFRVKVINECSEIVHKEVNSSIGPNQNDHLRIRNYHKGPKVGVYEYDCAPDEVVYHFSYDEYKFPYLVTLIDRLLSNDVSALDSIFNPDFSKEKEPFDVRVNKRTKEFERIDSSNVFKKIENLNELKDLIKQANLNKKQKDVSSYYAILQKLITLNLVDKILVDDFKRIKQFFNSEVSLFLDIDESREKLVKKDKR